MNNEKHTKLNFLLSFRHFQDFLKLYFLRSILSNRSLHQGDSWAGSRVTQYEICRLSQTLACSKALARGCSWSRTGRPLTSLCVAITIKERVKTSYKNTCMHRRCSRLNALFTSTCEMISRVLLSGSTRASLVRAGRTDFYRYATLL